MGTSYSLNLRAETLPGIYARYIVDAPFIANANKGTAKAQSDLCKMLKGRPLSVTGATTDEGKMTVENYYSRDYQAEYSKGVIRKQLGVCEHSIVPYTRIVLRHARPGGFGNGFTLYEYNDSGKPPYQWHRRVVSLKGSDVNALVAIGALGPGLVKRKPIEKRRYASEECQMYAISPIEMCITELDPQKYPITHLMLYRKVDHGGETTAVAVDLKSTIKSSLFFPPKGAPIIDADSKKKNSRNSTNATEKWCERQLKETGINPCKSDDD